MKGNKGMDTHTLAQTSALPYRKCSKHGVVLQRQEIAVCLFGRTFECLTCPVPGCGYIRSFKRPHGDRSLNRKTDRRQS